MRLHPARRRGMMGPARREERPASCHPRGLSELADAATSDSAAGRRSIWSASPVSYSTTAPARGPCSVFAHGGQTWIAMPDLPRGLPRDTFYAVMKAARGKDRTTAPDRVLAGLGDLSPRSVQRGLLALEKLGVICRERVGHHGGRLILIAVKLAGRDHSPAPSRPIRQPIPDHSPADSRPPIQGVRRGENAAPTGQPARSWPPVASEDLPTPCPAMLRFFPRFLPDAAKSESPP